MSVEDDLPKIFVSPPKHVFVESLCYDPSYTPLYVYPPRGGSHEIDSFLSQTNAIDPTTFPTRPPEYERVLDRMESFYSYSRWSIRPDFLSDDHIDDCIITIMDANGDKSPGSVLMRAGFTSNRAVLAHYGSRGIRAMVRERVDEYQAASPDGARWLADPFRVFIKDEPHSLKKRDRKAWRLIWGVSLIDQIVDRLLYTEVCQASLDNAANQAAKPGYSFMNGGVHRMVDKYGTSYLRDWQSFDASGFDLSIPGWLLQMPRDLNERLCLTTGDLLTTWQHLSLRREVAAAYGSFAFSDGTCARKLAPMFVPSGRFTTIDGNCKIMLFPRILHDVREGRPSDTEAIILMGDDSVQRGLGMTRGAVEQFVSFAKSTCNITLTIESELGVFAAQNFCSTRYALESNGYYIGHPLNVEKILHRLSHQSKPDIAVSSLVNACITFAYDDKIFDWCLKTLASLDPTKVKSRQWCQRVHLLLE